MNPTIPQNDPKHNQRTKQSQRRAEAFETRSSKPTPKPQATPILEPQNVVYEVAAKSQGTNFGGLPMIQKLAHDVGLTNAIDEQLDVLKIHNPYHESDHVMTFALNSAAGGKCLQDIDKLRQDQALLDALGTETLPAPSTAGDFTRRFEEKDIHDLQNAIDEARKNVWAEQPKSFFQKAVIDVDGTILATFGDCKEGADFAYKGVFGYHPLVVTLANTNEVLSITNRSANRPSHEGAACAIDNANDVCFSAGFENVLVRGDTDFSQTQHLDRWHEDGRIEFVFGYDAYGCLKARAANLPTRSWQEFVPESDEEATESRSKPTNERDQKVRQRGYTQLQTRSQQVNEFDYQPVACERPYRMVVVKKYVDVYRHGRRIGQDIRYFFFLTNDYASPCCQIVRMAHQRCNQENLISQLKTGCCALWARVDTLLSNWAYMVLMALGQNLKSWLALVLAARDGPSHESPESPGRFVCVCEFRTFVEALIRVPAQVVRTARRLVVRLLGWNRHQSLLLSLCRVLNC